MRESAAAQRGQVSPIRDVWKRTRTCSGAKSGEAAVAGELRGDAGFGAGKRGQVLLIAVRRIRAVGGIVPV